MATYEYDAYGNTISMSGTEAVSNPIRFSTKYFDAVAGLYDYGFRFYDPVTGRWLSRDPIEEDGGINLYGFVGNGPVNAWDEYGLDWFDNATNFAAGIGDGTSGDATKIIRSKMGTNIGVDTNSPWYKAGDFTSYITAVGRGLVVKGGIKLGAKAAGKAGAKAVARSNLSIKCVDDLLAAGEKATKLKRGQRQVFVKGDINKIFNDISRGGRRTKSKQGHDQIEYPDGSVATKYPAKSGYSTIQINKGGKITKVRIE